MIRIIRFFVERSFYVNLITFAICALGIFCLMTMKRGLIPPLQWPRAQVKTLLPGATPAEIEKFVTFPLEEALQGVKGVEEINSVSTAGSSQINIQFYEDFEGIQEAMENINSRINSVRYKLPQNIREILVERRQINDEFLVWLGLSGFDFRNVEHRRFAKAMEDNLAKVPGVVYAEAYIPGRNVHINILPERLARYEISIPEIRRKVRESLDLAPVGQSKIGNDKYQIEIDRLSQSVEDIKNLAIRTNMAGYTLYLKDIARVEWEVDDSESVSYINGKLAATFGVRKSIDTDVIEVKERAWKKIEDLKALAPAGVEVINLVDGPYFIEQQIRVLKNNGLFGLIAVILILMLFMNWKSALMTAAGLPIAYFGTLALLMALGISIDLLSIVGMILVIGILVDDAIIVSERYSELREQGLNPKDAATQAVSDLIVPVTGTVLTTIFAFVPMIAIGGGLATAMFAVPVIVISALLFSWFESFFILPNHLAHFVPHPKKQKELGVFDYVKSTYKSTLAVTMKLRYLVLVLVLALIGVSGYVGATKLKHNFNLNISSEYLSVFVEMNDSISNEDTFQKLTNLTQFLSGLGDRPEVENNLLNIGRVWRHGEVKEGSQYAEYRLFLDRSHPEPSVIKEKMKAEVIEALKDIDQTHFKTVSVEVKMNDQDESKAGMANVIIEGGEDLDFADVESYYLEKIKTIPSIASYVEESDRFQKAWRFQPDVKKLNQHGISTAILSEKLRSLFIADEVIETRLGGERILVKTELDRSEDLSFQQLGSLRVVSQSGATVPLSMLGNWVQLKTLASISHHQAQRNITLKFRLSEENGNITTALAELDKVGKEFEKSHPSVFIRNENADLDQERGAQWALKVALICIVGVLLIISFILGSLTQPLIVGLPILFGLIGVSLSLYLHGMDLGLMALVGLLGTIGVSVNASIVMMDQINALAKNSKRLTREQIIDGSSSRLRAILITMMTTVGGVFPMAYGIGGESGFTQPLAFSLGWGLVSASVLTMFVIPTLLTVREDFLSMLDWILRKFKKSPSQKPAESEKELLPVPSSWQSIEDIIEELPSDAPVPPKNEPDRPHQDYQ